MASKYTREQKADILRRYKKELDAVMANTTAMVAVFMALNSDKGDDESWDKVKSYVEFAEQLEAEQAAKEGNKH